MSVKIKDKRILNYEISNTFKSIDEKTRIHLKSILESGHNLAVIKDDNLLKKRIETLNSRFYQESDKYLGNKLEMERNHENLYLLLFKQIGLYIDEIDRLNNLFNKRSVDEKEVKIKK